MAERVEFKRTIGLFMAVMIGIGAMMGPGIFALPGPIAQMLGPIGFSVYLVMGIITIFTALNYAELGAALPVAGGGYSFVSLTLPRPVAFLTGWFFWIGNVAACGLYAVIFAVTIKTYFWPDANAFLIALVTALVFGAVNLRGMSEALVLITVMNLVELVVLIVIAAIGAFDVEAPNLVPLAPMGLGPYPGGMALVYISFVGYELITVAAEEIKNPGRTIPRAILITLAVGTVIYVAVVFVMMGAVHYTDLAKSEVPFILVAEHVAGGWGRWAAVIATIMASLSAFAVTLGASARVLFALSRDGHFPKAFARIHPKFRTPHLALAACTVFTILLAGMGAVDLIAAVADFGFLMGLGFVNYAVIALRKKMPALRRPFSAGFFPWIPIIGIVTCWAFVPALHTESLVLGSLMTVVGMIVYAIKPENRAELGRAWLVIDWVRRNIAARKRKQMRILIIGGGRQGQNIAKRLTIQEAHHAVFREAAHQITFIEPDESRCRDLEMRFGVPIFQGDGTKREILEQVGVDNVDVVIAASNDDGRNVIAAIQAKQLGMSPVIAVVQDPDYLPMLEAEGVVAISAPWATAAMVETYIDRPGVAELFEVGSGAANLLGIIVPEGAVVAGRQIKAIEVPPQCVIAAVIRDKEFVVPRGDTTIESGDEVVFVGPPGDVNQANDVFTARRKTP